MKNIFISLGLLCVFSLSIFSQNKTFRLEYDFARFNYDDSSGYFELYYSFYQPEFQKYYKDNVEHINGSLIVSIIEVETNEVLIDKEFNFNQPINQDSLQQNLVGNLGFRLPFSRYNCVVMGVDKVANIKDSVAFIFDIKPMHNTEYINLSDIQLASNIHESQNKESVFYKNTFEIFPNPSLVFGQNIPLIYFYAEIYNIKPAENSEYVKVEQSLINSKNQSVFTKQKSVNRRSPDIVEVGVINISKYPSGSYTLVLAVYDSVSGYRVLSSKRLFVYNPEILDTVTMTELEQDVLTSEFMSMSEEELDEAFEMARYISTSKEIEQWGKVKEIDVKRKFLFTFWQDRARISGMEKFANNSKEYYERTRYANDKFGNIHRKGWKTDRGRVYIMYGEPSEIDRFPNQIDVKPYEIWYYNSLEGGVIFVFGDITGFAEYQLIHSTMRGEMRDDNWQRRIRTN